MEMFKHEIIITSCEKSINHLFVPFVNSLDKIIKNNDLKLIQKCGGTWIKKNSGSTNTWRS